MVLGLDNDEPFWKYSAGIDELADPDSTTGTVGLVVVVVGLTKKRREEARAPGRSTNDNEGFARSRRAIK